VIKFHLVNGHLSTKPSRRTAEDATKLTNKPRVIVKNMYYNELYL